MANFNLPDQSASDQDILTSLNSNDWANFRPDTHIPQLRKLLTEKEKSGGVSQLHKNVSELLIKKTDALLRNNYGHKSKMVGYALSPNGKHLATISWVGDDYEAGGDLMVWEVVTGRPISTRHLDGGGGWPDYENCVQWSADGQLLGVNMNTNGLAIYKPFDSSFECIAEAYVTDGYSRPAAFAISPDGEWVTVMCHYDGTNVPGGKCRIKDFNGEDDMEWFAESYDKSLLRAKEGDEAELHPMKWVKWSNDGKSIYGSDGRHFYVINAEDGTLKYGIKLGITPAVAVSPDEKMIAFDQAGLVYNKFEDGSFDELPMIVGITDLVWAPTKDKQRLALVVGPGNKFGADPGIHIYEGGTHICSPDTVPMKAPYDAVDAKQWVFSPDGEQGACLNANGLVQVWSIEAKPKLLHSINVDKSSTGLFWGADNVLVAVSGNHLQFVNTETGSVINHYQVSPAEGVSAPSLAMSPINNSEISYHAQEISVPVYTKNNYSWMAAFPHHGVVLASDVSNEDIDKSLNYVVGNSNSWPWRWAETKVFATGMEAKEAFNGDFTDSDLESIKLSTSFTDEEMYATRAKNSLKLDDEYKKEMKVNEVQMAKKNLEFYTPHFKLSGDMLTLDNISQFLGKAVLYSRYSSNDLGTLVICDAEKMTIIHESNGSSGMSNIFKPSDFGFIAIAGNGPEPEVSPYKFTKAAPKQVQSTVASPSESTAPEAIWNKPWEGGFKGFMQYLLKTLIAAINDQSKK